MPAVDLKSTCPDPNFVRIDAAYCDGSGIATSEQPSLMLYRREMFEDEFQFMSRDVLAASRLGWILGPPGTGKSATAFTFLASLDRAAWDCIWIHLNRESYSDIILFSGDEKFSTTCPCELVPQLIRSISSNQKKQFLVIDGFVSQVTGHPQVQAAGYNWIAKDKTNRRLVIICSMASRGKSSADQDSSFSVKELTVYSWSLSEYLEAVKYDPFFQLVDAQLDAMDPAQNLNPTVAEKVEAKFHYAGGSARYMFRLSTASVMDKIRNAIDSVGDISAFGVSVSSLRNYDTINRLFSIYKGVPTDSRQIVSLYAEQQMALMIGSTALTSFIRLFQRSQSGTMNGGFFEDIFFLRMKDADLRLECYNMSTVVFKQASVKPFRLTKADPILLPASQAWMRPLSDTNKGFDAVFVNMDAKMARFVQLCRGERHSFKMEGPALFLENLVCEIEIVEFCFVVRADLLFDFKIDTSKISGQGMLRKYKVAGKECDWLEGKEHELVVILSMDGIL